MPILSTASLLVGMGNLGLNLLSYLTETQSQAPLPTAINKPFVPPFTGGQCLGNYSISIKAIRPDGSIDYGGGTLGGKILGIATRNVDPGLIRVGIENSLGQFLLIWHIPTADYPLWSFSWNVLLPNGFTDNCGNLSDPDPSILNPDAGNIDSPYVESPETVVDDNSTIEAIVPAVLPALVPATLQGLLALLAAAANIAELAAAIKALLEKIFEILDVIISLLRELEKLLNRRKSVVSRPLGSFSKDGFLRLYPFVRENLQAIQLDIRFTSIPSWKKDSILGQYSPNLYKGLGRILFVSSTNGIIKEIELKYAINSLDVPENAIGFYYHLGLDGVASAQGTVFYLKAN